MIEAWFEAAIISFSLILARVAGFVVTLPYFGSAVVPRMVRIALVFALTVFWFIPVGVQPFQSVRSPSGEVQWFALVFAVGRELLLGGALGYTFSLFFVPFRVAGEFIAQEMGLTLASITDPTNPQRSTVIGQTFEIIGVFLFFGMGAHHLFFAALNSTFVNRPVGTSFAWPPMETYIDAFSSSQEWGLLLAAPVASCLFIGSLILAMMARAAPQLNIMSVGFALRITVGMAALFVFFPNIAAAMVGILERFSEFAYRLT